MFLSFANCTENTLYHFCLCCSIDYYHNLSIDEVRKLRIKHINGVYLPDGSEDCRSCNLAATSDVCLVTRSRRFSVSPDGQYLKLELTPKGEKSKLPEFFTNAPGLLEYLAKPGNFSFHENGEGRIQAEFFDVSGQMRHIYLQRLVHFYYQNFIVESNFRINLHALDKLFPLDVDHFNNDCHNHTKWNLSSMTSRKNQNEKKDLLAHIKPPYYCYGVTLPGGKYRMMLGFVGKLSQWDVVDCDNIDGVNACIRSFLALDKKPVFVSPDDGAPVEVYKRDKGARWMALDFELAATMAEKLLNWDGRIIHWEDGASLEISDHNMISYIPA